MKFRTFAIAVFLFGLLSLVASLSLNRSRNRAELNPEFAAATMIVTDKNFDDVVLASEKPVVLDFFGDYCVVCKQLETKLPALANEFTKEAVFARVNVQAAPELIQRYDVREVPTLVMIHRGDVLFRGAGLTALPPLRSALESMAE